VVQGVGLEFKKTFKALACGRKTTKYKAEHAGAQL
jgi:hypothetical protein